MRSECSRGSVKVMELHKYIRSLDPSLDRAESLVLTSNAVNTLMNLITQDKEIEGRLRDAIEAFKETRESEHNN